MKPIVIDGGRGEGGGQIIRSALTLSCITRRPIRLTNMRKNRRIAGLRPQHLAVVNIMQQLTSAKVSGARLNSTELEFIPDKIQHGSIHYDIRTAGSISLVIQSIIPLAVSLKKRLQVEITGGTDVPWSPTMDYTRLVLSAAMSRMGLSSTITTIRRGYYPSGRGRVLLELEPSKIRSAVFTSRITRDVNISCTYSKISKSTIQASILEIKRELVRRGFNVHISIDETPALDSAAAIVVFSRDQNSVIGTDALYNKKRGRFDLDLKKFIVDTSVDDNLADMLVVPASLSSGKTIFDTRHLTDHLQTNLYVAAKITGCKYGTKDIDGYRVIIQGTSDAGIE